MVFNSPLNINNYMWPVIFFVIDDILPLDVIPTVVAPFTLGKLCYYSRENFYDNSANVVVNTLRQLCYIAGKIVFYPRRRHNYIRLAFPFPIYIILNDILRTIFILPTSLTQYLHIY